MSNSRRGLTARQPLGPKRGRADLKHLRAMTEAEIRPTVLKSSPTCRAISGKDAKLVKPAARRPRKA